MLAVVLLGCAGAALAADDDEAWIARYMGGAGAPGVPVATERAQRIEFAQLSGYIGRRVRVQLNDNRERRGVVERASNGEAELRSKLGQGHFSFTLSRGDVRTIWVD